MEIDNFTITIVGFLLIGSGTLFAAFKNMNKGFGPNNLRIVGIILVATFAAVMSIINKDSMNASIGILGAIVGYLFGVGGFNTKKTNKEEDQID